MMASIPALLLAVIALAQPAPVESDTIVVTGVRLQDYRDQLATCLARNCPPNEDIDATLALAEALFVAGEYRDARTAIRASLSRNRNEAHAYPEPVADLYRANALVARSLGLDRDAASSTREILRSLQTGLPTEDHRHFTARLEIAQSMIAFGQYEQARRALDELAERARAAGREDVAAMAELRAIWVSYLQAPHGTARRRLVELSEATDPRRRILSIGAKMLLVRIYSEQGETARADALVAELGRGSERRRLLFSPPYELLQADSPAAQRQRVEQVMGTSGGLLLTSDLNQLIPGNFEDKWIDVGFWIRPDGRIDSMEVLRRRGDDISWANPLLQSIRGRRYSTTSGGESTYRLERYTYTSGYEMRTGSHTQQRSPRARIEYFDLGGGSSAPEGPPAAAESGTP